jgi:hypothetical protein
MAGYKILQRFCYSQAIAEDKSLYAGILKGPVDGSHLADDQ